MVTEIQRRGPEVKQSETYICIFSYPHTSHCIAFPLSSTQSIILKQKNPPFPRFLISPVLHSLSSYFFFFNQHFTSLSLLLLICTTTMATAVTAAVSLPSSKSAASLPTKTSIISPERINFNKVCIG